MGKSTQANINYSSETFQNYILQLSTDLVWKNQTLANECESTDPNDRYRSDLFVLACRDRLTFSIIKAFPRKLLEAFYPPSSQVPHKDYEAMIDSYATDKNKIPVADRADLTLSYQDFLKKKDGSTGNYENYVETNNYYRMLMGFPDLGDTDLIEIPYGDSDVPISELPITKRYELEDSGELAEIIAEHPDKEYLKFVGRRRIDFFNSRVADRFALLWKNNCDSEPMNDSWESCYDVSRRMVLSVYYSNAYRATNTLYDRFIAMAILFATIQQLQKLYLDADVTRDFYDTESLKIVYDSYGVPFYQEIPIKYHRKIVKNIDNLISAKGSDNVFFELFDIFDLGAMNLYNYFLVRRHRVDSDGKPIFDILVDGEGNPIYDEYGRPKLNPATTYEWKFSKVKIGEDPAMGVSDVANDVDYDLIVGQDPYWVQTLEPAWDPNDDVTKVLYSTDINFIESKYIGVEIVYDIMKITYEYAYLYRMIVDNRDKTSANPGSLAFHWADVGFPVSIFDMFIYLALLIAKRYDYSTDIAGHIPGTVPTLGYNFVQLKTVVEKLIDTNEILSQNSDLRTAMNDISFGLSSLDSVSDAYEMILNILGIVTDGYLNATSLDEFYAYTELYNALLISEERIENYMKPDEGAVIVDDDGAYIIDDYDAILYDDGEMFQTFEEILSYYNNQLETRYESLHDDEEIIDGEISLVLAKLEEVLKCVEYLPVSVNFGYTGMTQYMYKILNFFKSVKAELLGYNIAYVIRSRAENYIKMTDRIREFNVIGFKIIDDDGVPISETTGLILCDDSPGCPGEVIPFE